MYLCHTHVLLFQKLPCCHTTPVLVLPRDKQKKKKSIASTFLKNHSALTKE